MKISMENSEIMIRASNRLEELIAEQEQNDFKRGWIYYRLKDEFGEDIARKVYGEYLHGESSDDLSF